MHTHQQLASGALWTTTGSNRPSNLSHPAFGNDVHSQATNPCQPCTQLTQGLHFRMHAGDENPLRYPLLSHLQLHSATGRSVAALTITAWARAACDALGQDAAQPGAAGASLAEPTSGFPYQEVLQVLTALLAAPAVLQNADGSVQPFAELASAYSIMRQHAQVHDCVGSHECQPLSSLCLSYLSIILSFPCIHSAYIDKSNRWVLRTITTR